MEKVVAISEKTDGRDKFTKAIQYGARLLAWYFSNKDVNMEKRFRALMILARDSRKMFRLFKSLNEYKILNEKIFGDLIWQPNKTPIVLEILSRIGFFFYWIFDNIQILASIKFLNADAQFHLKIASWGWFFGVLFSLAKSVLDLMALLNKKAEESSKSEDAEKKKDSKIDVQILKTLIEISAKLGDLICAANAAGVTQKVLGHGFSEGTLGVAGLYAALVSLWAHYNK